MLVSVGDLNCCYGGRSLNCEIDDDCDANIFVTDADAILM